MKCNTVNNTTEGIAVNAGAAANKVYRGQRIRMVGNSVKQFNNLSFNYCVVDIKFLASQNQSSLMEILWI